jgi:lactate dehydrogenase-like 2-hydroxyacid dehydrogenase
MARRLSAVPCVGVRRLWNYKAHFTARLAVCRVSSVGVILLADGIVGLILSLARDVHVAERFSQVGLLDTRCTMP